MDPWSRGREVARGIQRSSLNLKKGLFFAIGEGSRFFVACFLHSSTQMCLYQTPGRRLLPITGRFVNTVTRGCVGAPNERAPSRFHAAVVGFVDRCPSRTRNSPRPINIWLSFFSGRSWPKICPAITFFGVSEKFKTFLRRFVLIASGTEIFWRESLKFKLFLATSRFRCHRSQRQSLSWPLSQLQSDSHQLYVCNISMQPLHTSPPFSCGGLPSKT